MDWHECTQAARAAEKVRCYAEAETLYRRALAVAHGRGLSHSYTTRSLASLAGIYEKLGRLEEAEAVHNLRLEIHEDEDGPDHADALSCRQALGWCYFLQERYAEAEQMMRHVLEVRQRTLGPGHPECARTLSDLASVLSADGRRREAEPLFSGALPGPDRSLGERHPHVAEALGLLSKMREAAGHGEKAPTLAGKGPETVSSDLR